MQFATFKSVHWIVVASVALYHAIHRAPLLLVLLDDLEKGLYFPFIYCGEVGAVVVLISIVSHFSFTFPGMIFLHACYMGNSNVGKCPRFNNLDVENSAYLDTSICLLFVLSN